MYDLKTAQQNFAKLNLQKIEDTIKSLSRDKDQVLDFVSDPDSFLRRALDEIDCSPNLHCHVIIGENTTPQEITELESSIVFRTHVTFNPAWKDAIVDSLKKSGLGRSHIPGSIGHLTPETSPEPSPSPDPSPNPDPSPSPKPDPKPPTESECKGCGECIGAHFHFGDLVSDPGRGRDAANGGA